MSCDLCFVSAAVRTEMLKCIHLGTCRVRGVRWGGGGRWCSNVSEEVKGQDGSETLSLSERRPLGPEVSLCCWTSAAVQEFTGGTSRSWSLIRVCCSQEEEELSESDWKHFSHVSVSVVCSECGYSSETLTFDLFLLVDIFPEWNDPGCLLLKWPSGTISS